MKRHPSVVILFCVVALIVLGGMALAPAWGPDHRQAIFLQVMGIIFGPAYFVALLLLLYAVLTKKWEPYMDASIQKLEAQLTLAKMEIGTDPSTSSG